MPSTGPRPTRRRRRIETRAIPRWSDHLEAAALTTVAWILRRLGVDRASALMGFLWRRLAPFNSRHARADGHLAAALPELSAAERRKILDGMWDNLGRTAAETMLLPDMIADPARFELATEVDGRRPELQGGAVFASLHQGNWEFCGWGIRMAGFRTAAVYRPLTNPLAEAFLRSRRLPIYDAGLYPRDAASALKLRTLARGGAAIGMLADLRDGTGLRLPFFGRETVVASFPIVLARRLGLPLIAGRVLRKTGASFRVEAVRIDVPRTDDVEADILAGTIALHGQFEDWIRERPEQWMWAHRKWPRWLPPARPLPPAPPAA